MISQVFLILLVAVLSILLVAVIVLSVRISRLSSSRRPQKATVPERKPEPAAETGIPEEIVAAIAGAVYCLEPGARVKAVRRASPRDARLAWRFAGLLNSTRPF